MKNVRHLGLMMGLILMLGSCKAPSSSDDSAWDKWQKAKLGSYEMTMKITCFCLAGRVGPHQIVVKDGAIATVNGQPYDVSKAYGNLPTIDELFALITIKKAENPFQSRLNYDPTYGFPSEIYFDPSQNIADDEIGYQITGFKILK